MARRKPAPEGAKTYQVLSRLYHDGELYEPDGSTVVTIELDDEQAKPLLAVKVIQGPLEAAAA